jgi:hypothetical protein
MGDKMNLSKAKKGEKYITQDSREAVFIGRDKRLERPFIFIVDDQIWTRNKDGKHCETCNGSVYPAIVRKK